MKYIVTVPPTAQVGSYKTTVSSSSKFGTETIAQKTLCDYNSVRAHDGLEPVSRMPAGTKYTAQVEFVLQGKYPGSNGWEDLTSEETRKEARAQMKCYQENEGGNYRIVRRAAE